MDTRKRNLMFVVLLFFPLKPVLYYSAQVNPCSYVNVQFRERSPADTVIGLIPGYFLISGLVFLVEMPAESDHV